jgi:hypothetical protein
MASRSLRWLCVGAGLIGAAWPAAAPAQTCDFAIAGWIATRVELQEARSAYQACLRAHRTSCTAEEGRVRDLEQRLRLLNNYVEGYCRR